MLWRLQEECQQPVTQLCVQYRMAEEIQSWPSRQFYGGTLRCASNIKTRTVPAAFAIPSLFPYTIVDVCVSRETLQGTSWINIEEANAVCALVDVMVRRGLDAGNIGVITGYRAQANLISSRLQESHKDITVSTVDSFQGSEMDMIVFSMVRANNHGCVGFLKEYRRLNVALTRAKFGLVVFTHCNTLESSKSKDLKAFIQDARNRNRIMNQKAWRRWLHAQVVHTRGKKKTPVRTYVRVQPKSGRCCDESMVLCIMCGQSKSKSAFSKTQLREKRVKAGKRVCLSCVSKATTSDSKTVLKRRVLCVDCNRVIPASAFSKRQLKNKPPKRRCMACIEKSTPCGKCGQKKPRSAFSKTQLRKKLAKGGSRICLSCVAKETAPAPTSARVTKTACTVASSVPKRVSARTAAASGCKENWQDNHATTLDEREGLIREQPRKVTPAYRAKTSAIQKSILDSVDLDDVLESSYSDSDYTDDDRETYSNSDILW